MNKALVLLALACVSLFAQDFTVSKETSLTTAAEAVTIQQSNSSGWRRVTFDTASVYCSVACDFTIERDGTAASSTAATIAAINPQFSGSATATAWSTSNVGTATSTLPKFTVPAGSTFVVNLNKIRFIGRGSSQNITIRTSSITGTARITFQWTEGGQ